MSSFTTAEIEELAAQLQFLDQHNPISLALVRDALAAALNIPATRATALIRDTCELTTPAGASGPTRIERLSPDYQQYA